MCCVRFDGDGDDMASGCQKTHSSNMKLAEQKRKYATVFFHMLYEICVYDK